MSIQLSPNFWSDEFRCPCGCDSSNVHPGLVRILQALRDAVGEPLRISSGNRCAQYNETIEGAARRSWHIPRDTRTGLSPRGHAADVTYVRGLNPGATLRLYVLADQQGAKGLGLYHNRIHLDVRPGRRARWVDKSWSWSRS